MTNKNYVSGRNFEYRVRDYLASKGYLVVRSAGSKGVADLVVFKRVSFLRRPDLPTLIQCKHGKSRFPQRKELIKIIGDYAIRFIVASTENRKIIFYEFINDDDNPEFYRTEL